MFRDFANLLEKYKDPIINSFIMVEKVGNGKIYDSRLSNGPIESINRKVKDLKRLGRGFRNFEHFRNRFLYATRSAPILNGVSDYNPVTYFDATRCATETGLRLNTSTNTSKSYDISWMSTESPIRKNTK